MEYELHVTVEPNDESAVERWVELCENIGIKPVLVILSKGDYTRQLLCSKNLIGDFEFVKLEVRKYVSKIEAAGFRVIREKLECPLYLSGQFPDAVYHETHIIMKLTRAEAAFLPQFCEETGMQTSYNPLQKTQEREKWYLTSRHYGISHEIAADIFRKQFEQAKKIFPVHGVHNESAIYDTNPAIDIGWVE